MVTNTKNGPLMSYPGPALEAVDEVRQLNRVFLSFLRARPRIAVERFGLTPAATELLRRSSLDALDRAASFPRALFGFRLPAPDAAAGVADKPGDRLAGMVEETDRCVLQLALLHSAWNLCRTSGYSARLLLRLGDEDVARLRAAEMSEVIGISRIDHVVHAAFDRLEAIWRELLTQSRPDQRRRLWLIGLQPGAASRQLR